MGYRAHIQTKHIVEYGSSEMLNWQSGNLHDWLTAHGVDVINGGECGELPEWELDREQVEALTEEDFNDIGDYHLDEGELRDFITEMKSTKTGNSIFVSWF